MSGSDAILLVRVLHFFEVCSRFLYVFKVPGSFNLIKDHCRSSSFPLHLPFPYVKADAAGLLSRRLLRCSVVVSSAPAIPVIDIRSAPETCYDGTHQRLPLWGLHPQCLYIVEPLGGSFCFDTRCPTF